MTAQATEAQTTSPPVPNVIRLAWGDQVVVEFVPWVERVVEEKARPWLEQMIAERAVPRDEYREVLSRLDVLEHDVAAVHDRLGDLRDQVTGLRQEMNDRFVDMERHFETRFDQMNERSEARFDQVNDRFVDMERHFEARFDQMNERLLVQTRWLIGSIALFGTLITILMAIAQFTP